MKKDKICEEQYPSQSGLGVTKEKNQTKSPPQCTKGGAGSYQPWLKRSPLGTSLSAKETRIWEEKILW